MAFQIPSEIDPNPVPESRVNSIHRTLRIASGTRYSPYRERVPYRTAARLAPVRVPIKVPAPTKSLFLLLPSGTFFEKYQKVPGVPRPFLAIFTQKHLRGHFGANYDPSMTLWLDDFSSGERTDKAVLLARFHVLLGGRFGQIQLLLDELHQG